MKKSSIIFFSGLIVFFSLVLFNGCADKEEKVMVSTASEEAREEFMKGRDLFEKLKFQNSLQHFENAIEKDPDFALAYYYHSLANPTAKGFFSDLDKAVVLAENTSEGERLMILALQSAANGDPEQQKEYLMQLAETYPDDERVHSLCGNYFYGQQEYNTAITHLDKATEIDPEYSAPYNMLGYCYKNMENYEEAEKSFQKYVELIPDDPNPYDSYAEMLLKTGKFEESVDQYQKALDIDPNFVASHIGIATNYNYMEKHKEAREQLKKMHEMARNDGEKRAALFAMAVSYFDEGDFKNAASMIDEQYKIAEEIDDNAAMGGDMNTMGNIMFEAGKYDEAKKMYDKSFEIIQASDLSDEIKNNNKRLALYNLAKISIMKNDLADAKAKSAEFMKQSTDASSTFHIWLAHELEGMIAMSDKDYNKAIEEFKKANQQNPYTHYRLALAYQSMDDMENAKEFCEKAAKFNSVNSLNQSYCRTKAEEMLTSL